MSAPPSPAVRGVTRRSLLAGSAAGLALLVAGCTSAPSGNRPAAGEREAAALRAQVPVQEAVVAAYRTAGSADPSLGTQLATLASQAGDQLSRLRAAAPAPASAGSSTAAASSPAAGPPAGQDPRAWLRAQVTTAADSHAAAALDLSGARAALIGSIAAGLRGQAAGLS